MVIDVFAQQFADVKNPHQTIKISYPHTVSCYHLLAPSTQGVMVGRGGRIRRISKTSVKPD
jgi:hypothetical protein